MFSCNLSLTWPKSVVDFGICLLSLFFLYFLFSWQFPSRYCHRWTNFSCRWVENIFIISQSMDFHLTFCDFKAITTEFCGSDREEKSERQWQDHNQCKRQRAKWKTENRDKEISANSNFDSRQSKSWGAYGHLNDNVSVRRSPTNAQISCDELSTADARTQTHIHWNRIKIESKWNSDTLRYDDMATILMVFSPIEKPIPISTHRLISISNGMEIPSQCEHRERQDIFENFHLRLLKHKTGKI